MSDNIAPETHKLPDDQHNASEKSFIIHGDVKVKPSQSVSVIPVQAIPFDTKSIYKIDFTATSTPMQPPRKRCRTRGGCVQIPSPRNAYQVQFEEQKYKQQQNDINSTPPAQPQSPQNEINNEINNEIDNEINNKINDASPDNSFHHSTKGNTGQLLEQKENSNDSNTFLPPVSSPHTLHQPQLSFSEDELDDDILLNDIVGSSIPPVAPQNPVGNVRDVPSAILSSSSVPPQASYIPNIPSYGDADVFSWNNISRPFREFQFTGTPGVKVVPNDNTCPLSVLKTFLTDRVISNIVLYTNTYAVILKLSPSPKKLADVIVLFSIYGKM